MSKIGKLAFLRIRKNPTKFDHSRKFDSSRFLGFCFLLDAPDFPSSEEYEDTAFLAKSSLNKNNKSKKSELEKLKEKILELEEKIETEERQKRGEGQQRQQQKQRKRSRYTKHFVFVNRVDDPKNFDSLN